ncbi:MAG: hypothetical protein PHI36_01790 [Bacteroidales bacterium]|nr:hypothetical protein [Bacteroidales bacterium]
MKKLISFIFVAVMFLNIANAQELVSKKGFTILPEAGDIVLGFDAVPLVDLALNFTNIMVNTGQTAAHPGYVNGFNQVIVGKYFLSETKAIRAKIGINTNRTSATTYFDDPADVLAYPADPDQWGELKDVAISTSRDIILAGGLEFRRGHNRLQGFYGAEALLGLSNSGTSNKYDIEMNQETVVTNGWVAPVRTLSTSTGNAISFGVRGFVGVEYFFAPKMSIGGEFGWGLGIKTTPRGNVKTETWVVADSKVKEETTKGLSKGSSMGWQVDNGFGQNLLPSAALTVNFHF